jgi:hypothetical protein
MGGVLLKAGMSSAISWGPNCPPFTRLSYEATRAWGRDGGTNEVVVADAKTSS